MPSTSIKFGLYLCLLKELIKEEKAEGQSLLFCGYLLFCVFVITPSWIMKPVVHLHYIWLGFDYLTYYRKTNFFKTSITKRIKAQL
jgi:hypothetical protein